jgi:hypothetical protein
MDWLNKIDFVDNNLVYTFNPENKTEAVWPYNQPFFFLLSIWQLVEVFWRTDVDDSIFPQDFSV